MTCVLRKKSPKEIGSYNKFAINYATFVHCPALLETLLHLKKGLNRSPEIPIRSLLVQMEKAKGTKYKPRKQRLGSKSQARHLDCRTPGRVTICWASGSLQATALCNVWC